MDQDNSIPSFSKIRGSRLNSFSISEGSLNARWIKNNPGDLPPTEFFMSLENCKEFSFQPVPNSTLIIQEKKILLSLDLEIEGSAKVFGNILLVTARPYGTSEKGYLRIQAEKIGIFNSAFDPV